MKSALNLSILIALTIVLCYANYREGGKDLVWQGLWSSRKFVLELGPIFMIFFLIMGQAQVFMERNLDVVRIWISGGKGIFLGWVAGAITPSILALYPLFLTLWEQHTGRLAIIMALISFPLMNWQILPFKVALLGWGLGGISFLSGLLLSAVAAGFLILLARMVPQ